MPFSNYARTSKKDTSNMIMNLCDYEHTWTMCIVVWVKVSSPLHVAVISKGFLTLTNFKVEWTDTNTSPFSSCMYVPMADSTTRQNSIQGICPLAPDSLTSIPVAFQVYPFNMKQTRSTVTSTLYWSCSHSAPAITYLLHFQLIFNAHVGHF